MSNKSGFVRGLIVGIVIAAVLFVGVFGFLIFTNTAHFGQAAEVIYRINMNSYDSPGLKELVDGAMDGIVESLDDPYSAYLDTEEFDDLEQHISGRYGGIGLLISENEDDQLVVVSPFKGTPAYKAGIKSGDIITEINGKNASDLGLEKAANLMKGTPGTEVTITVMSGEESEDKEFDITREEIQIPTAEGKIVKDNPRLAYINLMMFSQQTETDLNSILNDLNINDVDGVILDLRDNPGGSLDAAVDAAGYFMPQGPAVHISYKSGERSLETRDNYIEKPLVVLINEGSASASEIVAGAIQDNNSGTIVGTTTFGKGLVQSVYELSGGAALKLTTAKYLTPDKRDINEKGIDPDVAVEMSSEQAREALMYAPQLENDLQLQKAVEILKNELSGSRS